MNRVIAKIADILPQNSLDLVIVRSYLSKLLDNGRVVRFLSNNHPDMMDAFQQTVESTS